MYIIYWETGKQGWHSGKRTRLPPLWWAAQIPALNPSVSLLLVLSFGPRGFLQVFWFSPLLKNSKFQFDQESSRWRTTKWMCYLFKSIIYLLLFVIIIFLTFFIKNFLTNILFMFSIIRQFLNSKKKSRYWPGRSISQLAVYKGLL